MDKIKEKKEEKKDYMKEYHQRPEVKQKVKEYYLRYKKERDSLNKEIWRRMQVEAQEFLHPKEIETPLEFNKILIRD